MSSESLIERVWLDLFEFGAEVLPDRVLWETMSLFKINLPDVTDQVEQQEGIRYLETMLHRISEYDGQTFEPEGNTVLDIGCGPGRVLVPFVERGADGYGVDISGYSLMKCRRQINQLDRTVSLERTEYRIPFDAQFDLAYSLNSFMRMNRPTVISYMRSAYEQLRPEGLVYFHYPDLEDDHNIQEIVETCRRKRHSFRVRYFTADEVTSYLETIGYRDVSVLDDNGDLIALARK